jgi:DNA-binding PadR family transcriptional regulator
MSTAQSEGISMTKRVTNPLALAVLAFLVQRPMHPYELGKLLKERHVQESIRYKHASLYMVVGQLSRDGYIVAQETVREGQRPERTVYRLSDEGEAELRARMRELVAEPVKEYPRFEAALSLIAVLPPAEVTDLLEQRRNALTEQAERIRTHLRESSIDPLWLIEDEYRLEMTLAEMRFIERFQHLIAQGGPQFGEFWRQLHASRQA